MADKQGLTEKLGVNLTIQQGATLEYLSHNVLTLTASNVVIELDVGGKMNVNWGQGAANTLIEQANNVTGCYIYVHAGFLKYIGFKQTKDTIAVPIWVTSSGTFTVTSETGFSGGWLIVTGQVAQTNNCSVLVSANGSAVYLSNTTTLECDNDYQQTSGSLVTTDNSTCTLQDGAAGGGTAVIKGGDLDIDNSSTLFGGLDVNGNLNFSGTYDVEIQGDFSGANDFLGANGTMTIQNTATLSITVFGGLQQGGDWTIISANNNLQPFQNTNEATYGLKELVGKSYILTS